MTSPIIENNKSYYPALDGLRGLAIILVVLVHNFGYTSYFFFGWLGVDIFFVLSGFLITQIILQTIDKPHFLRNFYIRRTLRIFPLYYLTLIILLIILPLFKIENLNISYFTKNQFFFWIYGQNWLFIFKEPYGAKLLLHLWSLAVEEQFYLFWPLAILLIRKPKILLLVVSMLLIATNVTRFILWTHQIRNLDYFHLYTFTRIDGLCIGCMVALSIKIDASLIKKYTLPIILSFAGLNYSFYFFNKGIHSTLPYLAFMGYTTFAFLFGYLVYETVFVGSIVIKILVANRLMIFFGKISYALYVFHWPIYLLLFLPVKKFLVNSLVLTGNISDKISSVIVALIAIVLSSLSYRYFEKYFLHLKDRFSEQKQAAVVK